MTCKASRRSFIKSSCGAASALALQSLVQCDKAISAQKPNVLFIAIDDLRDWTGYLEKYPQVKTPNLDRLSKRGMIFKNAYCAAPVCSPSRTALFTGLSPAKTGIYWNKQWWQGDLRKRVTLTRQFMNEGYYAAGYGKMYHGRGDIQYWHHEIYGEYSPEPKNPEHPHAMGNPLDISDLETGDGKRVTNAIKQLQTDHNSPLFLACGLVRPHTPFDVPRKYYDLYPLDEIELPPYKENDLDDVPFLGKLMAQNTNTKKGVKQIHKDIVDENLWKINIQAYLASITFADAQLGRLLDAWDTSKYSENGIVVLWGDHGWHLGEKDHWSKRTLWEEGTRTPFLISAPGVTKPGSVCEQPVSLLDLYPTLIELCGLTPRKDLDGMSIAPLLKNPELPWDRGAVTVWGKGNASVRTKRYRYIHYMDKSKELYDHSKDPNEWNNLATDSSYIKIINQHHKWIPKHFADPAPGKLTPWYEKSLRAN